MIPSINKIAVSDLKLGMSFEELAFVDPYKVFLSSHEALQEKDLEDLRKLGVQEIQTHGKMISHLSTGENESEPAIGGKVSKYEKELLQIKARRKYNQFQEKINAFSKILQETARVLEASQDALLKREYNRVKVSAVSDCAKKIIDSLTEIPLLVVCMQHIKFGSSWIIHHQIHSALYGVFLGRALGYTRVALENQITAMLFMKIGMFVVPLLVRNKKVPLKQEEVKILKANPLFSYRILKNLGLSPSFINVALQHREAFDGTGYPNALKGEAIDKSAMVANVCDVYTAMIESRPYRKSFHPSIAVRNLLSRSGKHFDPYILRLFIKEITAYPLGTFVKLNDGRGAMVIHVNPEKSRTPVIRLMRNEKGEKYGSLQFMDVSSEAGVRISGLINPASIGVAPAAEF